jgi:hypothetical protein
LTKGKNGGDERQTTIQLRFATLSEKGESSRHGCWTGNGRRE